MSATVPLKRIAEGRDPGELLLGNCRMEWQSGEAYGAEAILELARAAPFGLSEAVTAECTSAAAIVAGDTALFADVYDGRVGRLWRIGPGVGAPREPAVAVAFDPDMSQQRGSLYLRAEDHRDLDPAACPALQAAAEAIIGDDTAPMHRVRAFAIRAFSHDDGHAALFVIHRLTAGPVRQASFARAAVLIGDGETRIVADPVGEHGWTPRL